MLSVTAKQIAAVDMTVQAPADVVYSGKAQQQKPVVKDGDKVLVEGIDYESCSRTEPYGLWHQQDGEIRDTKK